jgi:maltose alpha-D-glucosyltransferase/alpha-amylase
MAPQTLLCQIQVRPKKTDDAAAASSGVLYDPMEEKTFARALLNMLVGNCRQRRGGRSFATCTWPGLQTYYEPAIANGEPVAWKMDDGGALAVFGDRLALRVFRRVEEGMNPALELSQALTEKTSFRNVLPVIAAVEHSPAGKQPLTLAILQGFAPNQGDAWHYTRDALGRYFEQALARTEPPRELAWPLKSVAELLEEEIPAAAREMIGAYLESTRLLGQRSAEFHLALASIADDRRFAPEPLTLLHQRGLYQSIRNQTRQTLDLLRSRLADLAQPAPELGQRLIDQEETLLRQARRIFAAKVGGQILRTHGDYHLARILYTGNDFMIMGLEGAPDRSLSDRRRKRSPLRDVASMVCSFHNAASVSVRKGSVRPEDAAALAPWIRFWHQWVAATFLKAYFAALGEATFLPRGKEDVAAVLHFYLLKRSLRELHEDLRYRPNWVDVPLERILHLLETKP